MGLFALLWLLLWVPVVIVIHEAGHAVAAYPAGFFLTSFGVGHGRPLISHRGNNGSLFYIGRWVFAGGACVAVPRDLERGPRAAIYHGGGIAAQLVLAGLLALLPDDLWWVDPVRRFNLLVMLWNLLPWRLGGRTSDGHQLLTNLLRGRLFEQPVFAGRAALRRLLRFEEDLHSPVGTWYCQLLLAWADVMTGQTDNDFFLRDHPVSVLDPALDALQQHVMCEWHRACGRPLAALQAIEQLQRAHGAALPMASADLIALDEARAYVDLGETQRARAALSRLAGVSGRFGDEARIITLQIALTEDTPDQIAAATERIFTRGLLDPPAAAIALWDAADALADRQDPEPLRKQARALSARLLAFAEPTDRAPLLRRIGPAAGLKPSPL
ncbi:MAG: site-2 protease family protein [Myxococcota bacterium]